MARAPERTEGLQTKPPDGPPPVTCQGFNHTDVYLSKTPPVVTNKYFTGTPVNITAVAQVFVHTSPGPNQPCVQQFMSSNPRPSAWEAGIRRPLLKPHFRI